MYRYKLLSIIYVMFVSARPCTKELSRSSNYLTYAVMYCMSVQFQCTCVLCKVSLLYAAMCYEPAYIEPGQHHCIHIQLAVRT